MSSTVYAEMRALEREIRNLQQTIDLLVIRTKESNLLPETIVGLNAQIEANKEAIQAKEQKVQALGKFTQFSLFADETPQKPAPKA